MRKRNAIWILAGLLATAFGIVGLLGSETGSRLLVYQLLSAAPGEAKLGKIRGGLLGHLRLEDLSYRDESMEAQIGSLDFDWQPSALFSKSLKITQLVADGVILVVKPTKKAKDNSTGFPDSLPLPVTPEIDNLLITHLRIVQAQKTYDFRKIHLAIDTVNKNIRLKTLEIKSDLIQANGHGTLSSAKGLPLNFSLDWKINTAENGQWQGNTRLDGNLSKLHLDNRLSSPFIFKLNGDLRDLTATLTFDLQGEWANLLWPFAKAHAQIRSPNGNIRFIGDLNNYRLSVNGALVQQFLPDANLTLDGIGSLSTINLSKLDISTSSGLFHLSGNADWRQSPIFDINASGVDFNPAILNPALPGSLNFSTKIKGRIEPTGNQFTVELNKISGELRRQAFEATGTLAVNGEKLKISGLQIDSGSNRLAADGHIDKTQGAINLSINMPKLAALWPGLAGSLEGGGKISGGWGHPAVDLTLGGKALAFAEHKIQHLHVVADYRPDSNAVSKLAVNLDEIDTLGIRFDRVNLSGKGSLKQHDFSLAITSPHGNLQTALNGSWNQAIWRGGLEKLQITEATGRQWSLTKPTTVRVVQKTNGLEIGLEQTCIHQDKNASICAHYAQSPASGLELQLNATTLPFDVLEPWLNKNLKLAATLDAHADIKRNNRGMNGSYWLNTSPVLLSVKGKEIRLQASKVSGKLNGDSISADMAMNLTGDDTVKTHLHANIGKAQVINGNIKAEIADFSPIKVFEPQIGKINGHLRVNLDLNGTLNKPLLQGYLSLDEASIGLDGFGLNAIQLQANVDSRQGNRLTLQGSAQPVIVNDPEKQQNLELNSVVNLTADIQQTPVLKGGFTLEMPSAILKVHRPGFNYALNLTRSAIQGRVLDKKITADVNFALPKQDFVRGKFGINGNDSNALSGSMNASLHDFKPLEAFVPALSNVNGGLTADLQLGGTTTKPDVSGKVILGDAQADVERLGIAIRRINLRVETPLLTSDLLQIRGSAESGRGKLALDGKINLDPTRQNPVTITLTGKDFEVAKTAEAEATISPDLLLSANDAGTRITGTLAVPKALLKMEEIPENAVKVSPDEIILGETPPETLEVKAPGLFADVLVTLGKDVNFSGQGLKTDLKGQLHIIKDNDKLALQGNVNLANASYKSYGQDLTVRKGQFVFNGPADNPWVDVEAIRLSKDKKVTAVLHLSGLLENPQTRIASEPSLPESEALAYLVTGGPLNQVSKSDSNVLASAAIAYGADQTGWLADKLGFSDFSVQQGSTLKDTLLVMGKYLTPDFYMGAKVGMFNKQAVMVLKHRIFNNLNVETQAGTSQRVKLNVEFDGD